jgi:hypothetical protein
LENKLDYIKTLPQKKEEELKELVKILTKEKEKQILVPKAEKSANINRFIPLEKPKHAQFSMPDIEQSINLTSITSKVQKGTKENKKLLEILEC